MSACFPFILILMRLLLTGFHSSICFLHLFFRVMATFSRCWASSRSECKTVSLVDVLVFPVPVHLLSLTPKIRSFYLLIFAEICVSLPASKIALIFQKPILIFTLILKTSLLCQWVPRGFHYWQVIKISKEAS